MSLSRIARRISLPALLTVVLGAILLAVAPGRATPAGAAAGAAAGGGHPAWKTIPSWAVIGTADQVIPPAELTFMAKRAGARITDVNAGHLSLISKPSVGNGGAMP